MPATVVVTDFSCQGNKRVHYGTIALDGSYPTGGYTITPRQLGLDSLQAVHVDPKAGFSFEYDIPAQKLTVKQVMADLLFTAQVVTAGLGVAAAGANLQSGAGGPTATTNQPARGALGEVPAATNLSAVTGVRFEASGF